jgi:hypothetical protein
MGNRSMFVGMDVHKETIDISVGRPPGGGPALRLCTKKFEMRRRLA